jgi:hypothetical protein
MKRKVLIWLPAASETLDRTFLRKQKDNSKQSLLELLFMFYSLFGTLAVLAQRFDRLTFDHSDGTTTRVPRMNLGGSS